MKLAIIGSGISALGAAHYLRGKYDITIFEKENKPGGHSNTITVREGNNDVPIDTGFIVHNDETYPLLVQLLEELNVDRIDSDMSFSVYNQGSGLQFHGSSLAGLFSQTRRLFSPQHYRFLLEINRFNKQAPLDLKEGRADCKLSTYLATNNFSNYMRDNFIIPMGSAVWSTPIEKMLEFPAYTLIQFFLNHGFLGLDTQYQWKTIPGGVQCYVNKLLDQNPALLRVQEPVEEVATENEACRVKTAQGDYYFDKVILAAHAPDSLRLLAKPSELQQNILEKFQYVRNTAILHFDESVMPPLKRIWSAWNFKKHEQKTATVYWMNKLQPLNTARDYFVSINEYESIDSKKIVYQKEYEHPLFDMAAIKAQSMINDLNAEGPVSFVGAWQRYGFHEDGLWSAKNLVENMKNAVVFG